MLRAAILLRAAIFVLLMTAACAAKDDPIVLLPNVAASNNNPVLFTQRIPGKWLFTIEATSLKKTVKPSGACAEHNFPVELDQAFTISVVDTLRNVFDEIEEVPPPITADEAKARKAKGEIVVRRDEVGARAFTEVGQFISHADAAWAAGLRPIAH